MMPTVRSMLARALAPWRRAAEGQPRRGLHYLPISGGWIPAGAAWNWWQQGHSLLAGDRRLSLKDASPCMRKPLQACPARIGGQIITAAESGWRIRRCRGYCIGQTEYQSISDFMLDAVRSLFLEGNYFALALRNARFEVESLHLMNPRMSSPLVGDDGSVWFRLAGNAVVEQLLGDNEFVVPQRNVLHVKLHSDYRYPHPLVGEPPLTAAMMDIAMTSAFAEQQLAFLKNQARPSAVLSTDLVLDKDQTQQLRDRWNESAKGLSQGGTPILTGGLTSRSQGVKCCMFHLPKDILPTRC